MIEFSRKRRRRTQHPPEHPPKNNCTEDQQQMVSNEQKTHTTDNNGRCKRIIIPKMKAEPTLEEIILKENQKQLQEAIDEMKTRVGYSEHENGMKVKAKINQFTRKIMKEKIKEIDANGNVDQFITSILTNRFKSFLKQMDSDLFCRL